LPAKFCQKIKKSLKKEGFFNGIVAMRSFRAKIRTLHYVEEPSFSLRSNYLVAGNFLPENQITPGNPRGFFVQ
jgi:hypothetical protein